MNLLADNLSSLMILHYCCIESPLHILILVLLVNNYPIIRILRPLLVLSLFKRTLGIINVLIGERSSHFSLLFKVMVLSHISYCLRILAITQSIMMRLTV